MGKQIGLYFREKRKEQKLSVATVSKSAGISKAMIDYIEAGTREPSLGSIARLAAALGIKDITEVVGLRDIELVQEAITDCSDTPEAVSLLLSIGDKQTNAVVIKNHIKLLTDLFEQVSTGLRELESAFKDIEV